MTVSTLDEGERMVWFSGMPLGLFKGERTFTLTPEGAVLDQLEKREQSPCRAGAR
ncbi:MAG: hypothetical protein ACI8RZ_005468 [Myxococcota bacterium]